MQPKFQGPPEFGSSDFCEMQGFCGFSAPLIVRDAATKNRLEASDGTIQRTTADDNLHVRGDSNPRDEVCPPGGLQDC